MLEASSGILTTFAPDQTHFQSQIIQFCAKEIVEVFVTISHPFIHAKNVHLINSSAMNCGRSTRHGNTCSTFGPAGVFCLFTSTRPGSPLVARGF